jgi:hypothetical protein
LALLRWARFAEAECCDFLWIDFLPVADLAGAALWVTAPESAGAAGAAGAWAMETLAATAINAAIVKDLKLILTPE